VDSLKIDQAFVRLVATTSDDTSIVSALIGMGRSLKWLVFAEGVESAEVLALNKARSCDRAQRFYFGTPHRRADSKEKKFIANPPPFERISEGTI